MVMTRAEVNRLVAAYWKAVGAGNYKLANYIRTTVIGCCGIDVAEV